MTDKSPEDKAAELADSVNASKAQNRSDPSQKQKITVLAVSALLASVVIGYMWWPTDNKDNLKTSESASFISDGGSAFGNMGKPEPIKPIDPNPELLKKMADLEAKLAEALNREPEVIRDDAESQLLKSQLEEIKLMMDQAKAEYERALTASDLERQKLQAQLDAQRFSSGLPTDNEDAKKLAAEQIYQKRVNSPLSPLNNAGGGDEGAKTAGPSELDMRKMSGNELFKRFASSKTPLERAEIVANPANTVLQGTVIQASLETAINTDLPGMIRAVVAEDVHSLDGSRVLIPRGSKVLGKYSDDISLGQKRVMVIWDRLLLPDNQTVTINSYGADAIGQAGVKGKVDTHFFERFGSATLISVIGIAPAVATASLSNKNNNNSNNSSGYNDANNLANAISQNMNSSLGGVVGEYLNRAPTIGVKQGANVTIFVDRDLEIF
jgi:type IV secretion system protein VirB10